MIPALEAGHALDKAGPPRAQTPGAEPCVHKYGRRWNQTPVTPGTAAPRGSFTDADDDGKCDTCGLEQGKNTDAPGFADADNNGVCDNLGTATRQSFGGGRNRR